MILPNSETPTMDPEDRTSPSGCQLLLRLETRQRPRYYGAGGGRRRRRRRRRSLPGIGCLVAAVLALHCFCICRDNGAAEAAFSSAAASESGGVNGNGNTDAGYRQLRITFVTGNSMKATEVNRILADHGATCGPDREHPLVELNVVDVDLPEIQEVDTIAIAKDKVILGAQLVNGPCLVEDTSLQFHALGGMPGPYIKWFQERLKPVGLYNILEAYPDQKTATAVCTLAFCPAPHADPVLFTGECHGTIVPPEPGRGFGWDSIFVPDVVAKEGGGGDGAASAPGGLTFSQMSTEEKCELSHRGKAVRKWADWLGVNQDALWERQERKKPSSHSSSKPPLLGHQGLTFKDRKR